MTTAVDICKICLRTDVKLKEIDNLLVDYHQVLTDFALFHLDSKLCLECEHLLRKCHNFNQKCKKAASILIKWVKQNLYNTNPAGKHKKPLRVLHKEIEQSTLGVYAQGNTFNYRYKDEPLTNLGVEEESVSDKTPNDGIKKEIESELPEINIKDVHSEVKTEATNTFQEFLMENDILNDNDNDDTGIELVNENDTDINDSRNDDDVLEVTGDNLSSDDECLAAKKIRNIDAELAKTNDNATPIMTQKRQNRKKDNTDDRNNKTEKNIIAMLQIMNEDLKQIYVDWKKTSLTDLPVIPLTKNDAKMKKNVAKRKLSGKEDQTAKKKGVISTLTSLSADLDSIRENCGKLINFKEGMIDPKERLRSELTAKFAACGELKTEDGFLINKETVLSCFDRVSECLMRRLWRFVHGKPTLEARAINTLKHIQNKYQNEYQYETVFHIEYLNTKEKVAEEFEKRQTYECYLNARYKCELCYLGFKYEAQVENHKNSHEESAGNFTCPTCGVRHRSKKSLDTHSKSHEAVYKCKLCPLVTYYRYSMMNHFHQHEGVEYKCEQCDATFKSKSAYRTHIGLRHTKGTHTCTTCGRSLATERALNWHIARAHTRGSQTVTLGDPVPCLICNLKFASQHAYLRHARSTHTNNKYITQKDKDGSPKKKPVHTCRVCNAVGNSIGWLTLHFRLEHPSVDMALTYADKQLHLCEICGKGYTNVYNLRDHLSTHLGVRAHACSTCGARFHRAVSLAQHAATHLPPRRACHHCGKRFHSQSNLNNHMRGHTGDRRYKCNLCGKGFLHRNALNEHIRGVHYKLRRVRKKDKEAKPNNLNHITSN